MNTLSDFLPHPEWDTREPRIEDRKPEYRLLTAVVLEAMRDYFVLRRMGAIRFMKLTGKWKLRSGTSFVYSNMSPHDARELIWFFENRAHLFLNLAGWKVTPLDVRRAVVGLEKSGRHYEIFAQGVVGASEKRRMTYGED